MAKVTRINGELFTVKNTKYFQGLYESATYYDGTTIYDEYDRPSGAKVDIYRRWKTWADNTPGVECFGVSSANSFKFTIMGLYFDGTHSYPFRITDVNQELYMPVRN